MIKYTEPCTPREQESTLGDKTRFHVSWSTSSTQSGGSMELHFTPNCKPGLWQLKKCAT
uniref:Uncharacterized protein n=1 Tax=Nelumbo nucifera TaxID=4432 RepID=A0A822YN24_NELNU|nr:TPA_asm: hypothetical protein HUJ06_011842 [Nelumbo nucifera]